MIIAYSGIHHREAGALSAGCDAFVLKPAVEELESLVGLARRMYATMRPMLARPWRALGS